MRKFERVTGNDACLKLLKMYVREAERGMMNFCGVFSCEGNRFSSDYTGDINGYHVGFFALDHLTHKMRDFANIAPFRIGEDKDGPADKWVYDLNNEPICHDFVLWLITAEMIRRREKARSPLRIGFIRGKEEKRRETKPFYENVMLPALELFGAVADPITFEGRRQRIYATKEIVEACRKGEEVPRIQVPEQAAEAIEPYLKGDTPVTITLRETEGMTHRNSNMDAWVNFAHWLKKRGERVIILRDTAKADESLEGIETFPAGSRKLFPRVALYECAKCNLFVSNGPQVWALFGSRPWLCFVTLEDDEHSHCNRPAWWARYQGIIPGEQFPWSGPQQRMIYAEDTFENLCAAWEEHMEAKQVIAA